MHNVNKDTKKGTDYKIQINAACILRAVGKYYDGSWYNPICEFLIIFSYSVYPSRDNDYRE